MLSVIVPVYNRAGLLGKAIESLADQETRDIEQFSEMEILVIDDGSTDNTGEMVESLRNTLTGLNIRYIYQDHAGISKARNMGILLSRGEWIGFLDSDDSWHPEKMKKQFTYLQDHPDCKIIFTLYENYYDDPQTELSREQKIILEDEVENYCLATAFVHRSLFERNGLFCEELVCGEDSEWVFRNKILGLDVNHHINEPLYLRRIHKSNMSLQYRFNEKARIGALIAKAIRNAGQIRNKHENISFNAGI